MQVSKLSMSLNLEGFSRRLKSDFVWVKPSKLRRQLRDAGALHGVSPQTTILPPSESRAAWGLRTSPSEQPICLRLIRLSRERRS